MALLKLGINIVKALVVRFVFLLHCSLIVYRVIVAYNEPLYGLLLLLSLGIIIETIVTLWRTKGLEWKWFSPAIFFYLIATLPSIWLLELQLTELRVQTALQVTNSTELVPAEASAGFLGIDIPISLDIAGWALAMEQTLLFVLIFGRWILPKGDISRNQLSQILFVYLGMAADIMELFEVFKEEEVAYSQQLVYPILSLWSWSLFQYSLVITQTKAKKTRLGGIGSEDEQSTYQTGGCCTNCCKSVNIDVVGIMSTVVMQDGPFLCFRLYLIVGLNISSQMMIFFTCKNMLVLLLQIYRLVAIYLDKDDVTDDDVTSEGGDQSDAEAGGSGFGPKQTNNNNHTLGPNNRVSPYRSGQDNSARVSWNGDETSKGRTNDLSDSHPNLVEEGF